MKIEDRLFFLPLGGAGEIGMNLNLYGIGPTPEHASWIMADVGVGFSSQDRAFGLEMMMADPSFIARRRRKLLGIFITHAHEDHIGAAAHLWNNLQCPIYATPFAAHLMKEKFLEKGIPFEPIFNVVSHRSSVQAGPFNVEFLNVTHSTPESCILSISTSLGTIIHTGDWKIDTDPVVGESTDFRRLEEIADQGVLAVVSDSTNAMNEGTSGSEGVLAKSLEELIASISGGIAVTTFASNVARLSSLMRAAKLAGRKVALVGRSMYRVMSAALEAGYFKEEPEIVSEDKVGKLDKRDYVLICTGSQGESRAAMMRIANGTHRYVRLGRGDTVIFSSRIIPGNDLEIFALQNRLADQGIHVVTERDHFVHVSGHPCQDELAQLYQVLRPHILVPVHGEMRHMLEHARLGKKLGIPHTPVVRNGDILILSPEGAQKTGKVDTGRLYLDGQILVRGDDPALNERRAVASQGLVIVNMIIDGNNDLISDPNIHFVGIPLEEEKHQPALVDAIYGFMESLAQRKKKFGKSDIQRGIGRCVQSAVQSIAGKQPLVRVYFVCRD